ncbi:unnamed protein product [Arctogadus glacialis]
MKRFHISIHQQQHNYAAPSPNTLPDPPRKRARPDGPAHQPLPPTSSRTLSAPTSQQPAAAASRPTRTSPARSRLTARTRTSGAPHNFLERKRRNDLRSRFLLLRDEIPGLADCPNTPKVAILTRATQYLQQLPRRRAAEGPGEEAAEGQAAASATQDWPSSDAPERNALTTTVLNGDK